MALHLFQNMNALKMELDYGTLEAPAPYRLCASGSCKACGGRLCFNVNLPDYLYGDGLLAVVFHHMKRLHMDAPELFIGLFHEEDRPCASRWLDRKDIPSERSDMPTVYTIVQTGADIDQADFPEPTARGSYLSLCSARERLAELIVEEKAKLDSRYDTEKSEENWWEAYQDGYNSGCFRWLEILPSVLEKEGLHHE